MIVGGGVAGCAAALSLARDGASVLVADRSLPRPPLGECLPPEGEPILHTLGAWERFLRDRFHTPVYGSRSAWGSAVPRDLDYLAHPYGVGWRLDRPRFDALLARVAGDAGARFAGGARVVGMRRAPSGGRWILDLVIGDAPVEVWADFIIDATGRTCWVARRRGASVVAYDRLVGLIGVMEPGVGTDDRDSLTYVEAVEGGWWYAALLPDRRLVVALMGDADLLRLAGARSMEGWEGLMRSAALVRGRVDGHGYRLAGSPRPVAADSSLLTPPAGDGWCAVGDAAAAFDPLSSRGIAAALVGGARAATAVSAGGRHDLEEYGEWMRQSYARYLSLWLGYHALERRWPGAPFWRRRHAALEALLAPKGGISPALPGDTT